MKELNEIILRRRKKIILSQDLATDNKATKHQVATLMKNLEDLGYALSLEVVEHLLELSYEEVNGIYLELVTNLKKYVGADKEYNPMYPNFPEQVVEMEDIDLFFNALVHYLSMGTLLPEYSKNERLPLFDNKELTVIELGTMEDLYEIRNNLMTAKTSLSNIDKEDLKILFSKLNEDYPAEIPFKENVVVIARLLYEAEAKTETLSQYLVTATDVLRFVVELCNGDTSLAENTKFKSFCRKDRRMILQLLENCGYIEEDMLRYAAQWIRLGERLHPGEYPQYKKAYTAFDKLRNHKKISTFNSKLQKAIEDKDCEAAIKLLSTRPGEFARRLDHLIRIHTDKEKVIKEFEKVAEQVSTPVLLQVKEHFSFRTESETDKAFRVFFPKGRLSTAYSKKEDRESIDKELCDKIVKVCETALTKNYSKLDTLGKVFIDTELENYLVPQSQRSASEALKTITRGSHLPLEENTKVVRGFIWWTNQRTGRVVDIDLSVAVLREDFSYFGHISYTNLRSHKLKAYHSGDITNGGDVNGKGVAEFVDIDIESIVKDGGRYVIFEVHSFNGQKFSQLDNCMFGWMEREDCNSGEIFEPSTVEQKLNLTQSSEICVPVLFDCVKREFIWLDINMSIKGMRFANNLENSLNGVSAICYGMLNMHKPNMYDLVKLHTIARGELVNNRNEADIIFSNDTTKPVEKLYIEIRNERGEIVEERTEERVKEEVKIITAFDVDYWQSLV